MKEISEGQSWWCKGQDLKYGSWGAIHVLEKLDHDRWVVDIYHDPPLRDIVLNNDQILNNYYLYEKNK
jgi:hypothetical protein